MTAIGSSPAPAGFRNPRTVLWAIVVVAMLLRATTIARSFFWQDDFVHIWEAWHQDWAVYALERWNGHFEPASLSVYWLITRLAPQSWGPAMVYMWVLAAAMIGVFWLLVRRLAGDGWATTATVGIFATWPGTLVAQSWFAASLEATSFLFILIGMCLYASRRRPHPLTLVALMLAGAMFYEKALLMPVALFLLSLLRRRGSVRHRLVATLRGDWVLWLCLAVAVAVMLAASMLATGTTDQIDHVSIGEAALGIWVGAVYGLARSLAGWMWQWPDERTTLPIGLPSWAIVALLLIVALLTLAGLQREREQTRTALVVIVVALLFDVVPVVLARMEYIGPTLLEDSRFTTTAGIFAILAVSSFWWSPEAPPVPRPDPSGGAAGEVANGGSTSATPSAAPAVDSGWPFGGPGLGSTVGQVGAAAALSSTMVLGLISMAAYGGVVRGQEASKWLRDAREAAASQPAGTTFAATASPRWLLRDFAVTQPGDLDATDAATTRTLLDVGPEAPEFLTADPVPKAVSQIPSIAEVGIDVRSQTPDWQGPRCQFPLVGGQVTVAMPKAGLGNPVLSFDYLAPRAVPVEIRVGETTIPADLRSGLNTLFVAMPAGPFSGFTVVTEDLDVDVCLGKARAGIPVAE